MDDNITIGELTHKVANLSSDFERKNSDLKRKFYIWNIEAFNSIANSVSISKGSFGTGYPFYALDRNLDGTLPIIAEQFRYNRKLIQDGKPQKNVRWLCANCIKKNYSDMPDLKQICKPCPYIPERLKPRKIINRLPDFDMWLVCQDGQIEQAQDELSALLEKHRISTSDIDPLSTIDSLSQITQLLKQNKMPKIFLPIDPHIIEYSKLRDLILKVPYILEQAITNNQIPYLPILPRSYRKTWQYDDEAYNFIHDFLSSFNEYNFDDELSEILNHTRYTIANNYTNKQLYKFLLQSGTASAKKRLSTKELKRIFDSKMNNWRTKKILNKGEEECLQK